MSLLSAMLFGAQIAGACVGGIADYAFGGFMGCHRCGRRAA
ncbi:MAG TPA: hypothetical protein VGI50_15450 [Solirubrobacteraceae bacterium]